MDQRRTHRRLGVFVATGVVAAGLAAFPAFTFADGNGNVNGNGHGQTATRTATATATATANDK